MNGDETSITAHPRGLSDSIGRGSPKPRSHFLGGLLSLVGIIVLPLIVYYLWFCLRDHDGNLFVPEPGDLGLILGTIPTVNSVLIFTGWMLLHVILQIVGPGRWHEGTPLADGTRLRYKMNGMFAFWVSLGALVLAVYMKWLDPTILFSPNPSEYGSLITTVNIFAFGFSLFLYFFGKWKYPNEERTGNFFYDYFLGTSLNPRIGSFDFKFFMESRPGLIGWIAINFVLAVEQLNKEHGITLPMYLVFAFHFLYVADYFWHEPAILTTWDIKHEKFGWMLVWGDLVWVPFIYTLQAYYLVEHGHTLPWWGAAGIVALNLLGFIIFRGANWQKHCFRLDPTRPIWGRPAEYIRTQYGSLLLVSGWWGIARHLNYLGDLMMALAWCLPCLFGSPLPYFYFVYFLILLIHRERRDHNMCQEKYGADWDNYCRRVRWRILPYVY